MIDEIQLVKAVLEGDDRAFEDLVRQYEKLVFHILNRFIPNNEQKEDLAQEVFIKIYQRLKTFRFQSKLSTWIGKITYLTIVDHLKKHNAFEMVNFEDTSELHHYTFENPECVLVQKDLSRFINEAIQNLPINLRMVLTLYHLNEFSYKEIETITGWPEGTIKSHLFRGRRMLKEKLKNLSYLR